MGPSELIREVARASRLGEHAKIDELLKTGSYTINAVWDGWRLADRALRRDSLSPLAAPMDLEAEARPRYADGRLPVRRRRSKKKAA
jgi:hypothetical protein